MAGTTDEQGWATGVFVEFLERLQVSAFDVADLYSACWRSGSSPAAE
jgi:hypothetical protein